MCACLSVCRSLYANIYIYISSQCCTKYPKEILDTLVKHITLVKVKVTNTKRT